ncbi:myotubularin-related protein 3-like isoform X1 [Mizuhopecten yessoensis]|uniref:myotubularin-related protein 3-like isoform X1 n=2 Tax=Mizuhopecten yessoensis TaxID=6573 RepID=UPI000B4572E3|nr:myotubularin-related protein 3-like isoform X1 [Mizuhopecten yessoensis]
MTGVYVYILNDDEIVSTSVFHPQDEHPQVLTTRRGLWCRRFHQYICQMHDKMAYAEEPSSLDYIQRSELYPKKLLVTEDAALHVPFPLLCGEAVEFLGHIDEGVIALSNFRLLIRFKDSFINVPLGLVESVECRDIFYLYVYCKDATVARCAFSDNDSCQLWYRRVSERVAPPRELKSYFAFAFHAWCVDLCPGGLELDACYQLCKQDENFHFSFGKEVERMKFNLKNKTAWRITYLNESYGVCQSYPKYHIVPAAITDEQLKKVASFRALARFPSVVWRDQRNGAVLVRCSQPEVGWLGWRNPEDEALLRAIPLACSQNPGSYQRSIAILDDCSSSESGSQNGGKILEMHHAGDESLGEDKRMLVIDCRSYSAAFANRAKGGGLECPEYYPNCEIQFMNLANIHSIRKSFIALRTLCSSGPDQVNWFSGLENSKWLLHTSCLMKTANIAVSSIDKEGRPVLVHCSDGWDRTPQIISLATLQLDPYYRTMEGFLVLIEREWLDFGHKFADRCGNGINNEDTNERCPVFLQWIDCVYQIYTQFPTAFQFNEAYLVKLVQHTYSCLFGTFLCNTTRERQKEELEKRTASVWSLLNLKNKRFLNHLYCPTIEQQVLYPSCHVRSVKLWRAVFLSNNSSSMGPEECALDKPSLVSEPEHCSLQKTRSCENLAANQEMTILASPSRRKSDPNITKDFVDQALHLAPKDTEQNSSRTSIPNSVNKDDTAPVVMNGDSSSVENGHDSECCDKNEKDVNYRNDDIVREIQMNGESDSTEEGENDKKDDETERHNRDSGVEEEVDDKGEQLSLINEQEVKGKQILTNGYTGEDSTMVNGENVISNGHSNGIETEDKTCQTIKTDSDENLTRKTGSRELVIESSTDTLCEEDGEHCRCSASSLADGPHGRVSSCSQENVHCDRECRNIKTVNKIKSLESCSSISTSTSDISNSHVHMDCLRQAANLLHLQQCLLSQPPALRLDCGSNGCGKLSSIPNGGCHSPSTQFPTPVSSQTPNSTCPPTPGTDSKSSEVPLQRHLSGIGRHLDIDGLTIFNEPVQQRMRQIEADYERQILALKSHLANAQALILQHASACSGAGRCAMELAKDEMLLLPEATGYGDFQSLGGCSNAASDVSWEQIEDTESKMVKWVPDHAVTHCGNCDLSFGMINRKHHCRNCGNIFCHDCTNYYTSIPQQNLMSPERVCQSCYKVLRYQGGRSSLENGVIDERPMAAAASN